MATCHEHVRLKYVQTKNMVGYRKDTVAYFQTPFRLKSAYLLYLLLGSGVYEFYLGRFITGCGVGISCFALPLYSAEISPPQIRGATGSLFQLNVVVGCVSADFLVAKFYGKFWGDDIGHIGIYIYK
jgi:MFS family permease